jgi:excisionase family DNA binding protein
MNAIKFINRKEVCQHLQISEDTFVLWVRDGLPEYRIGRIIMVKPEELNQFIEAHGPIAMLKEVNQLLEIA